MLICLAVVYDEPVRNAGIQIEESLFPRIAAGDKEAFCALYEKCASSVFAFSLSILRDRTEAEDAMQETFLKIRSAAHLYTPKGKPMAWILTIARNICLMRYRRRSHIAGYTEESRLEDVGLDQIASTEDRIVLQTAFSMLPEDVCRIIMLHAVSGMKHREIASLLELPLPTVLSKYNRGIKKLRRELEGKL